MTLHSTLRKCAASAVLTTLVLAATASSAVAREDQLSDRKYKSGQDVLAAFVDLVAGARKSTVRVQCDGKDAALATVVSAEGLLLTKASEMKEPIQCVFENKKVAARVVAVDKSHDLALLKVKAQGLVPVEWGPSQPLDIGQWIATAGLTQLPMTVGVVGVGRRKIPGGSGVLGIDLGDEGNGPSVSLVHPDSGAEKAGLKVGDLIRRADDEATQTREALIAIVQKYRPGDVIKLVIVRGKEKRNVSATLGHRKKAFSGPGGRGRELVAGKLSLRKTAFPTVFQHDGVVLPVDCGGPVVDLSGKVVGINIARAGRTTSFAIPTEVVRQVLKQLVAEKPAENPAEKKKPTKKKSV